MPLVLPLIVYTETTWSQWVSLLEENFKNKSKIQKGNFIQHTKPNIFLKKYLIN